jgi:hypothetical protein
MRTLNVLPPYKGALLRGALDNTFRRLVCPLPRGDCPNCSLYGKCLYISLLHPSPPKDFPDASKFISGPPAYVLKPSADNRQAYHPQDTLDFELTLIGRALDALPYFIFAFDQIGHRGLGKERGRYKLYQVNLQRNGQSRVLYDGIDQTLRSLPPAEPDNVFRPSSENVLTLDLQTPLRIKQNGKLVTRLDFATLFKSLAQRIYLLSAFYGKNSPFDISDLQAQAMMIETVKDETYWYDWPRYSTRQRQRMKLGGLRGKILFGGDLTPFIPWLLLGKKVHVGQGTTFGLGGYSVCITSKLT